MKRTQNFGGRPPLPKECVRSERVVTFLTREENEQLHKLAAAQGKSVSQTCHDLLVNEISLCLSGLDCA
ncbi:MAG: hypothetical protein DRR11_17355 [Gammaproteobacteria bacterium]|nr:MAG: hypothetical protein DRR11_17355 [Gammaproteobacteria bacterium]RLA33763.1 MAG: hypothetical protein DRR15_09860 [Gammaproteobacteria bacterium]